MLLVPLQPLSGDPIVEPPLSSGVFYSGNGFQTVLQDAQQQLVATADPGLPDELPPQSLALVVAEALTEALASDKGVTNQPNQAAVPQGEMPKPTASSNVTSGKQDVIILPLELAPVSTDEFAVSPLLVEADVGAEIPIPNKQTVAPGLPIETQQKPVVEHRSVYNAPVISQQEQQVISKSEVGREQLPSGPIVSAEPQRVQPPPEEHSAWMSQRQTKVPMPLIHQQQEQPVESESDQVYEQNSTPVVRHEVPRDDDTVIRHEDERPVARPLPINEAELDAGEQIDVRPAQTVRNTSNVVMPDGYTPLGTVEPPVNTSSTSEEIVTPSVPLPVYDGRPITQAEQRVVPDLGANVSSGSETRVVTEMPVSDDQTSEVAPRAPRPESLVNSLEQEIPVVERAMPERENRATVTQEERISSGMNREVPAQTGVAISDRPVEWGDERVSVLNREAPVVDRPVQPSVAPVISDRPVESDDERVPVLNREAPVVDRPVQPSVAPVISDRPVVANRLVESSDERVPFLNREAPVVDRPVQSGAAPVVSDRPVVQSGLANFAPQQVQEQPVISQFQPQEGISRDSLPIVNRNENGPTIGQMPRVVSDSSPNTTAGQVNAPVVSSGDQKSAQTTPVLTGSAPAFSAEVERAQVFSTPARTGDMTVDGPGVQVASATQSSGGNMSESRDEQTPQRTLAPVVQRSTERPGQESFVVQQAVQASEQPVQAADPGISELDAEIGHLERLPTRIDMTSGASRTAGETRPEVDHEASAEQIERTYRVSEQIIRSARMLNRDGATQVTLRLDPPELGEVTIRLSTGQDRTVSGEIAVENQKVQEIVQRSMVTLREALAEQGIQIDRIDVSVDDRGRGLSDRESFEEALDERSENQRSGSEQERPQTSQETPEEISQEPSFEGGVNFMA